MLNKNELDITDQDSTAILGRKYIVSGRVQGVGFRYHTCHEGLKRGLNGYAKNLDNGDVEVVASGLQQQLTDFEQYLNIGPRSAKVEKLCKTELTTEQIKSYRLKGFTVLY